MGTTLTGSAGASPLLSAFTFGDSSLKFQWDKAAKHCLRLMLPQVPDGDGLQLQLSGPGQASSLSRQQSGLCRPTDVKALPAGTMLHGRARTRPGERFTLWIDHQKAGDFQVDPQAILWP